MNWLINDSESIEASINKLAESNNDSKFAVNDIFYNYSFSQMKEVATLLRGNSKGELDFTIYLISNATIRHLIDPLYVALARKGLRCDVIPLEYDVALYDAIKCDIPHKSIFLIDVSLEYFEQVLSASTTEAISSYFSFLRYQLKQLDMFKGSRCVVVIPDFQRLIIQRPAAMSDRIEIELQILSMIKELRSENGSLDFCFVSDLIRENNVEIFEEKYWEIGKFSVSPNYLNIYSEWLSSKISACFTRRIKCIALDLDNTLWGGVLGDDGFAEVRMSWESGYSYAKLQDFFKWLKSLGILLAIVSKNDPVNVEEYFLKRNFKILDKEDFIAVHASWGPKSESIIQIAEHLNIGVDSILFIDDSPLERLEVREALPNTVVLELNGPHESFLRTIISSGYLSLSWELSKEDLGRAEMYRVEEHRVKLKDGSNSDNFLTMLALEMKIAKLTDTNLVRAVQLINKTNQFNSTLNRISNEALLNLVSTNSGEVCVYALNDRFGDYGEISVTVSSKCHNFYDLTLWVMSCRVFSRGVELSIINHLIMLAKTHECTDIRVFYKNGPKNKVFFDLMLALPGFIFIDEGAYFVANINELMLQVNINYAPPINVQMVD